MNLCLDILGKDRKTGYHYIQTLYHQIHDFYDEIKLKTLRTDEIRIISNQKELPADDRNTAYQAVKLLKKKFKLSKGIEIKIKKNIPLGSGLGGGSSNAATVLKGLNRLWKLNLDESELQKIAKKIGMDVPFFIKGGTALGTHFGEELTQLPPITNVDIKIITPRISIATLWAYELIHKENFPYGKNSSLTEKMLKAINEHNPKNIIDSLHNDFDQIISPRFSEIRIAKEMLKKAGYQNPILSGTGSSVFGLK